MKMIDRDFMILDPMVFLHFLTSTDSGNGVNHSLPDIHH